MRPGRARAAARPAPAHVGMPLPRRPPRYVSAPPARAGTRCTSPFFHLFDPSKSSASPRFPSRPCHASFTFPCPLSPPPWIPTCCLSPAPGGLSRVPVSPLLAAFFFLPFLYPVGGVLGRGEIKNLSCPRPVVRLSRARLVSYPLPRFLVRGQSGLQNSSFLWEFQGHYEVKAY